MYYIYIYVCVLYIYIYACTGMFKFTQINPWKFH